ncbi:MAG: hypothetical protein ISS69_10270 [Phycisphaerae bacterium]|nr:hypothetical protein [Phycisphaerae bacterium]
MVLSSASSMSPADAAAGRPVREVKLAYDAGKDVTCLTRAGVLGVNYIESKTSLANLTIGGKKVPAAGWTGKSGPRIGLDTDGDGIVNTNEYRNVARDGSVLLTATSGGRELTIRCRDVYIQYDNKKNEVTFMRWLMRGLHGWVGNIDSVKIRIIDDNADGKYGNDGRDAILIGDSKIALPLRHYHRIGEHFYKFEIAPDGSGLKFQQIKSPHLGMVRSPLPTRNVVGLVLENGGGAFDIQACGKTGIPSGTYHLAYGAMGDPKAPLPFFRVQDTVQYEIATDKINMLRIGPPLQLVFWAEFKEEADDKNKKKMVRRIGIRHPDRVIGSGGEMYGPVSFPNARSEKGRPGIMILQGSKPLVKTVMPEWNGKVGDFWWTLPEKLTPRGIRVVMAARTQQLGKVIGMRTIQQIASKTRFAAPATDKPSVTTTPWNKSGKTTVGPKVVKPNDKPKPLAVSTRPSRPPKPAVSAETRARRLVKLARNYDKMRLRAKAVEILKSAIEKYPNTESAATAKELLKSMK